MKLDLKSSLDLLLWMYRKLGKNLRNDTLIFYFPQTWQSYTQGYLLYISCNLSKQFLFVLILMIRWLAHQILCACKFYTMCHKKKQIYYKHIYMDTLWAYGLTYAIRYIHASSHQLMIEIVKYVCCTLKTYDVPHL